MAIKRHLPLMLFGCAAAVLPLCLKDPYYLGILVFIGIFSIATMGLNLLMGYAGQISLGHAAFYALGAYTTGLLTAKYNVHFLPALLAAILVTAAIAYVVGIACLRLKGALSCRGDPGRRRDCFHLPECCRRFYRRTFGPCRHSLH